MKEISKRFYSILFFSLLAVLIGIYAFLLFQKGGFEALTDYKGVAYYSGFSVAEQTSLLGKEKLDSTQEFLPNGLESNFSLVLQPFYSLVNVSAELFKLAESERIGIHRFTLYLLNFLFGWVGLIYLFRILKNFYPYWISMSAIFLILIGSNFFIYFTQLAAYPDLFLFMLLGFFTFQLMKFKQGEGGKACLALMSFLYAVIILIEPAHFSLIVLPFLMLYREAGSLNLLRQILRKAWWISLLSFLLPFCLVYLLQGELYPGKYYFFQDQIYKALIEYRKGWLIYSPIMIFALIGLSLALKKGQLAPYFSWEILLYLALFIIVAFSWWNWWYSESFGQRVMIALYIFMGLGLAQFLLWIQQRKFILKFWTYLLLVFLSYLNLFQSWQYKNGILSKDGMTERLYWASFGEEEALSIFKCFEERPVYQSVLESGKMEVVKSCRDEFRMYLQWLTGSFPNGTEKNTYGVLNFKHNWIGHVYYRRVQRHTSIKISLDTDDDYMVRFYMNNQLIHSDYLAANCWFKKGLWNHAYVLDESVQAGFDKIEIEPMAGDDDCAIGQIAFY